MDAGFLARGQVVKSLTLPGAVAIAVAVCATSPRAADVVVKMIDVAAQSGLTLLNICGGPDKDFIVDEVGSGAAWLDFDNDGHLDALIVNGSTRERVKQGGDPMVALYRNDGKGHFADVTTASRLTRRGWGMGVCLRTTTATDSTISM